MTQTVTQPPAPTPRPQPSQRSASQPEPLPNQKRAFADALARGSAKTIKKQEQPDGAGLLGAILPRDLAGIPMAGMASSAGDVDAMMQAHLDRIAAAIAEVAKTGQAEVQLSLPLGNYRIDGAILGRDAVGNVNILLMPATAVPPATAAQWSEQLNERLVRRDVRVGRVSVQAPAPGKRVIPA